MARKSRKNLSQTVLEAPKAVTYSTWGYARISIDGDRSEDSLESQTAIIQDYADSKADLDLSDVITDLGFTGRDFDRPGYIELMDGIKRGDVQCVIVKDLSRLGRTYIEVGELLFDTFPTYNVRFISVNDQYDSFADDAVRKKLIILFKNLMNHMYSRDLGKKIRSAHTAKKQRAELSGLPPYGYKRDADGITLVSDGDAAEIVKTVFDMRLQGMSANAISKHLTRKGIPSPQNRRYQLGQITHEKFANRIVWNVGMISKMLQCETYTGTLVQGKYDCDGKRHTMLPKEQWIRHENTHPAIISREQFDAVQKLMQDTAAKYARNGSWTSEENRYSNKIFCARCGKAVLRINSRSTREVNYYYSCRHCDYDLKAEQCLKKTPKLSLTSLDSFIIENLRKQMDLLIDVDRLIEQLTKSEAHNQRRTELIQERSKWEKAANDTDKTLSTAYAHHLDGLLDLREFELVRAKVERDKQEAAAKSAQAESDLKKYNEMADRHKHWLKVYSAFLGIETPSRELIQALINRIVLAPLTNEIHVVFNYMDGLDEYREQLEESGVSRSA